MEWTDQSGAHKFIRDVFVIFSNIIFAMPALTGVLLLALATYDYSKTSVWKTPSMLDFMRQLNPRLLYSWNGLPDLAATVPVWLASLTLSLLIFVWATQKKDR